MNSDLIEFVETSFGSVWSLELLLLLYRDSSRTWTSDELVHELRSSEVVIAQSIERLVAAGLALPRRTAPSATARHHLNRTISSRNWKRNTAGSRPRFDG
jgi:hypothetical protein